MATRFEPLRRVERESTFSVSCSPTTTLERIGQYALAHGLSFANGEIVQNGTFFEVRHFFAVRSSEVVVTSVVTTKLLHRFLQWLFMVAALMGSMALFVVFSHQWSFVVGMLISVVIGPVVAHEAQKLVLRRLLARRLERDHEALGTVVQQAPPSTYRGDGLAEATLDDHDEAPAARARR